MSNFFKETLKEVLLNLNEASSKEKKIQQSLATIYSDKTPFNAEKFKKFKSLPERYYYLKTRRNVKKLGSGSSRIVYLVNNDFVIKLANGNRGNGQNKSEVMAVWCGDPKYYTEIYDYASDYSWLFVEMAYPIKAKDFEKYFGFSLSELYDALAYSFHFFKTPNDKEEYDDSAYRKLRKNSWFKGLEKMINACGLEPGDIGKPNSWGITKNNKIVLLDYGLSDTVFNTYYKAK